MEDIIVRYVHFVAILVLSAALVAEHLLLEPVINGEVLRKLAIIEGLGPPPEWYAREEAEPMAQRIRERNDIRGPIGHRPTGLG